MFDLCPAHLKEITDALKAGKKISAIKAFRDCTELPLKDCKHIIDFAVSVFDAICPDQTIVIDSEGNKCLNRKDSESQFRIISLFTEVDIIAMLDTDNMIDLAYRAMHTDTQDNLYEEIDEQMIDQFRSIVIGEIKRIIIDSVKNNY